MYSFSLEIISCGTHDQARKATSSKVNESGSELTTTLSAKEADPPKASASESELTTTLSTKEAAPPKVQRLDTKKTQLHYIQNRERYANKANLVALQRLFEFVSELGLDRPDSFVFVGGTNDGRGVTNILEACPNLC